MTHNQSGQLDFNRVENRVIGNIFHRQAQRIPGQPFLLSDGGRIDYADAYERAAGYALGLRELGVEAGDRVCLFMAGDPGFVLLSLACNLIGAQWVPVNTDYRGEWLLQTIQDSAPRVLITDGHYLPRVLELDGLPKFALVVRDAVDLPAHAMALDSLPARVPEAFEPVTAHYGDVASIMWTSGTTGRSKGVMQSHNAWVRSALSTVETGHMGLGDVIYNCMPLYNSAAWVAAIYPALLSGAPCAMDPAFSASRFWDRTRHYGATHVFTLGAMHMFLWHAEPRPDDSDNPVRSANMVPMPAEIMQPFRARFGIEAIHQGFGQSEIMLLMRRADDGSREWAPNALGEPAPDLEVMLADDDGGPVAVGEVGEFCVRPRAPHVIFNGYFNNPQATADAYFGDWFRTGDLGRADSDGNFFFVDRKKDLIRYKGRSVSSMAVEAVARRCPGVADVAAFGVPSAVLDSEHEIMLAVVPAPGFPFDPEALATFINRNAPYFFVPRYIDSIDALPLTPTQKVRKNVLRERGITPTTWDARVAGFELER